MTQPEAVDLARSLADTLTPSQIHRELIKRGVEVSRSTVGRWLAAPDPTTLGPAPRRSASGWGARRRAYRTCPLCDKPREVNVILGARKVPPKGQGGIGAHLKQKSVGLCNAHALELFERFERELEAAR